MALINMAKVSLVALSIGTAIGSASAANLVTNGSFEAVSFGPPGGFKLGITDADVPGWHIPESDGIYPWGLTNGAFGAGPAPDGTQWVVLGRYDTGAQFRIQQTVAGLTIGQSYSLSWQASSERGCCSNGELSFISGAANGPVLVDAPAPGSVLADWSSHSTNFTATATSVTFQFRNLNPDVNDGIDLGLDNVVLMGGGAVPEPAAWLMLIAGFGMIGGGMRGGRKAAAGSLLRTTAN